MLKKCLSVLLLMAPFAMGNVTFQDDFEGDLSQWIGKTNQVHHGVIADDPLNSGNSVLKFSRTNSSGDIFSTPLLSYQDGPITLSFDYLGISDNGGAVADSGGFVGFSYGLAGTHYWKLATQGSYSGVEEHLIDDGKWHSYSLVINPTQDFHIMIEDFVNPAGDAYFDNIKITNAAVPAPGALILGSLGTGLVGWIRRKK